MVADPLAACELQDAMPVQSTLGAEVHIFDTRRVAQSGELHEPRDSLVVANRLFPVEQQREPLVKGQRGEIGYAALFIERGGHAREFERAQGCERLFDQQGASVRVSASGRDASTTVVSWSSSAAPRTCACVAGSRVDGVMAVCWIVSSAVAKMDLTER